MANLGRERQISEIPAPYEESWARKLFESKVLPWELRNRTQNVSDRIDNLNLILHGQPLSLNDPKIGLSTLPDEIFSLFNPEMRFFPEGISDFYIYTDVPGNGYHALNMVLVRDLLRIELKTSTYLDKSSCRAGVMFYHAGRRLLPEIKQAEAALKARLYTGGGPVGVMFNSFRCLDLQSRFITWTAGELRK